MGVYNIKIFVFNNSLLLCSERTFLPLPLKLYFWVYPFVCLSVCGYDYSKTIECIFVKYDRYDHNQILRLDVVYPQTGHG